MSARSSGAVAVLLFIAGCGRCSKPPERGEPSAPAERFGVITGIVRLAEGTELPALPNNPLMVDGRSALASSCPAPSDLDRFPVRQTENGGLDGLSIAITGQDARNWLQPGEPQVHEVGGRDCRLTPRIVVATRGDTLRFNNDPQHPLFPDFGNGQLRFQTEPLDVPLTQGGVRSIRCAFAAPCGETTVITLYHPVHGVTGADGRFRIANVPAGQPVRVTAWHPLFEEATVESTVASGQTTEVELIIRPRIAQAEEAAVDRSAEAPATIE